MMSARTKRLIPVAVVGIACALTGSAKATYHTFKFAEVYSNPSGTIQFVELHESLGANGQNLESEAPDIFSFTGTSTIENRIVLSNLPNATTANKYFLLGTAGYNAIPGAPQADYIIPSNFFNPAGDSLQYGSTGPDGVVDHITFGALPSDVNQALFRTGVTGNAFITGPAAANTFADSGGNFAVPEPAAISLIGGAVGVLALRRRRRA